MVLDVLGKKNALFVLLMARTLKKKMFFHCAIVALQVN